MSNIEEIRTYYDRIADIYDERAAKNPYMSISDHSTWSWIMGRLPKDMESAILDAGGGTGKWAICIAKLGYRITVLDVSAEMLRVASKKATEEGLLHLVSIRQGNMEETDFPSESFDFILCEGDAFSMTPNPVRALREFYRILKTNGRVSLNICNHYKLLPLMIQRMRTFVEVRRYFSEPNYGQEPLHGATFRTWRPEEALRLIEDTGFVIEAYAPRQVLADLLSEEVESIMIRDEVVMRHIQELEAEFIHSPILAALGGHVVIAARKAA